VGVFFSLQIVLLLRLENTILLSIFWIISYRYILSIVLFPSRYIFAKGQKEVHSLLLIVSYSPISDVQVIRLCFVRY
jgi:hypothetical protein